VSSFRNRTSFANPNSIYVIALFDFFTFVDNLYSAAEFLVVFPLPVVDHVIGEHNRRMILTRIAFKSRVCVLKGWRAEQYINGISILRGAFSHLFRETRESFRCEVLIKMYLSCEHSTELISEVLFFLLQKVHFGIQSLK